MPTTSALGPRRRALAGVAGAGALLATALTAPALAAGSSDPCPTSTAGTGTALAAPASVGVLAGDYIDAQPFYDATSQTESLVCVKTAPEDGEVLFAGPNYDLDGNLDGTLYIATAAGTSGDHVITAGSTDGTTYHSTTVTVQITAFPVDPADLARTLKLDHGTVVRKATVTFANPATQRIQVQAGTFSAARPDKVFYVPAGGSKSITTARPKLDYLVGTMSPVEEHGMILEQVAQLNTRTGAFRVIYGAGAQMRAERAQSFASRGGWGF